MKECDKMYMMLGVQFCKYPLCKCKYMGPEQQVTMELRYGTEVGNATRCDINTIQVEQEEDNPELSVLEELIQKIENEE